MSFVDVIFGIILTVFSARMQGNVTDADKTRLHAIAQDIWMVSDSAESRPFQGEASKEATAIALTAIAFHESGFWSKVQDCSICYKGSAWCDHGRSVTLFQLREGTSSWGQYTRQELCESNAKASERALTVLTRKQYVARPVAMFDGYARGGMGAVPSRAAQEITKIFEDFSHKAGLHVTSDGRSLQAKWKTPSK